MEQNFMNENIEPVVEPVAEPVVEPVAEPTVSPVQEDYTYHYSYVTREEPKVAPPKPKKPRKKMPAFMKKMMACICLAIVFGIVASVSFQVSNGIMNIGKEENSLVQPSDVVEKSETIVNTGSVIQSDVTKVSKSVMPSVVSITSLTVQEVQYFFFGGTTTEEIESSGSGIIIGQNEDELLIVTNNHVVEGSSTLTVSFVDGASVEAQIKGTDADIDIAVIAVPLSEIEEETMDAIKVATLGDSTTLSVGEPAIAIGNALGYGQSVTSGIISALEREMEDFDTKLIQTDAAINPGNSGGPLLNANGEVIGINTVKVSADAVESMGYAIPISDVNDIINELMNRETRNKVNKAQQGTIGIKGITVDEEISMAYGIPQGVQVSELIEGGAAQKAGIPVRSIITKFDGTSIHSMEELQAQLEYYKAGETVEIVVAMMDVTGEYAEKSYNVTLGKQSILK